MTYFSFEVKCQFIKPETESMLVVEPQLNFSPFEWVKENKKLLEEYLVKFDGVLLRNFGIYSVSEFNKIVQIICPILTFRLCLSFYSQN